MSRAFIRTCATGLAALSLTSLPGVASAQAEPILGQIMCGAFNFAPRGWARLDGQLMSISTNTALFSLLGTQYGGNGTTNFALPDMRGRVLIHDGSGPGLTPRTNGEAGGAESVTLSAGQMPAHTHTVTPQGSPSDATMVSPAGGVPATKARTTLYAPGPGTVPMSPVLTSPAGSNAPVPVMQPFVAINCFIAVTGIFPARD